MVHGKVPSSSAKAAGKTEVHPATKVQGPGVDSRVAPQTIRQQDHECAEAAGQTAACPAAKREMKQELTSNPKYKAKSGHLPKQPVKQWRALQQDVK
jgi:hypothetical protein